VAVKKGGEREPRERAKRPQTSREARKTKILGLELGVERRERRRVRAGKLSKGGKERGLRRIGIQSGIVLRGSAWATRGGKVN